MEPLLPPPTPLLLLCKPPLRHPSTSINCKISKCNSACRMAVRGMAHRPSTTLYIRPNLSYLPNVLGLGKIVWAPPHGNIPEYFPIRVRTPHNKYRTQAFRGPSTATNNSNRRRHINTFNNRAAPPVYHRLSKINISIRKPGLSACRQHHRRPSRLPPTTLAHKVHLPNPSMGAVSTHLRTEVNHHMFKAYHMVVVPASHSVPQSCLTTIYRPRRNTVKISKPSSSNKECTTYELGSCSK